MASGINDSGMPVDASSSGVHAAAVPTPFPAHSNNAQDSGPSDNAEHIPTMQAASLNSGLYSSMRKVAISEVKLEAANDTNSAAADISPSVAENGTAAPPTAPTTLKRKRPTGEKNGVPGQARPRKDAVGADGPLEEASSSEFQLPPYIRPAQRYSDVGGLGSVLAVVRDVVEYPLLHPEVYHHLGVEAPRGVLLYGPPGVGKTLLANAIAGELGVYFRSINGPEIVGGVSGESEARLRTVFEDAASHAPAILFIDEIDAIAPKRDSTQRGMERRIVSQLLSCMDGLGGKVMPGQAPRPVLVMAATNRPDSIDNGLRRTGRFDREIAVPIPDEKARVEILKVLTAGMRLENNSASVAVEAAPTSVAAASGDEMAVDGQADGSAAASSSTAAASPTPAAATASSSFDYLSIARATPGYVGADLQALAKEAAACAIHRSQIMVGGSSSTPAVAEAGAASSSPGASASQQQPQQPFTPAQLSHVCVTYADFLVATKRVQPSALREGFATVPSVTWKDVGALAEVRSELNMAIVQPLRRPEVFAALNLQVPAGVLLYGPPGCGKTLLAKAIAHETAANFISVKGPELLDKYVGESERAVRQLFQRARASAPCIVFFDELDSLAPRRGGISGGDSSSGGSGGVSERVVNQLLTEMDGLEARRDVFVIAATNRPDIIDPAMLRPGRLDKLLYVPLPTPTERTAILATHTRSTPLSPDVDISAIATSDASSRFSGADLAALVREASVAALKEYFDHDISGSGGASDSRGSAASSPSSSDNISSSNGDAGRPLPVVCPRHFSVAFTKVFPSVSAQDERLYNGLRQKLRGARAAHAAAGSTPAATGAAAGEGPASAGSAPGST